MVQCVLWSYRLVQDVFLEKMER